MHENIQDGPDVRDLLGKRGKAPDRRVIRTRLALHAALGEILHAKSYDDISVIDICTVANVGRSAFYQHFTCKDDLFRTGFERLSDELGSALDGPDQGGISERMRALTEALLVHCQAHRRLYRTMASGHAGTLATKSITEALSPFVERLFTEAGADISEHLLRLRVCIVVSALLGAVRWWMEKGIHTDYQVVLASLDATLDFNHFAVGV